MEYIGPGALERTVRHEYHLVKGDYHRKDPLVVVGPVSGSEEDFMQNGRGVEFPGRGYLAQADHAVKLLMRADSGKTVTERRVRDALGFLKMYSCKKDERGTTFAAYWVNQDFIQMFPFWVLTYQLDVRSARRGGRTTNLPEQFRHELAHWDIGETRPFQETRGYFNRAGWIMREWTKIRQMPSEEGVSYLEGDGREFSDFLGSLHCEPGRVNEALVAAGHDLITKHDAVEKQIADFSIDVLSEAVASAFGGELSDIPDSHPDRLAGYHTAYNRLSGMIQSEPRIDVIGRVRGAINQSYEEKRDALEILGMS